MGILGACEYVERVYNVKNVKRKTKNANQQLKTKNILNFTLLFLVFRFTFLVLIIVCPQQGKLLYLPAERSLF